MTIRFDYQNMQYEEVLLDGKTEKIYVPFTMLTGMLLDKTSIYDIAATTFQPLMLREHFRCVPEIISFSIEIFRIQQDILPVDAALAALRTMEPELFIRADQHFLQVFSDVFQSVIHFDIPPIFKSTAARRLPYILCKLRAGATFCLS